MEETKTSGNRWNRTKKDWLRKRFKYKYNGILFKNKLELSRYLTSDRIMTFEELKEYRF